MTATLAELDRLHAGGNRIWFMASAWCAYPALRSHIAGLEAKAKAFDAIERRLVFIDANTNTGELVEWSAWAGDIEIPSKIADGFDLLTAIDAALAAKESKHE